MMYKLVAKQWHRFDNDSLVDLVIKGIKLREFNKIKKLKLFNELLRLERLKVRGDNLYWLQQDIKTYSFLKTERN